MPCHNVVNWRDKVFRSRLTPINLILFEKFLLTHLLLYGCDSFVMSTNQYLLLTVIDYLKAASRLEGPLCQ